jgi:hypothetical protein
MTGADAGVVAAARQRLSDDLAARRRPFAAFAATVLVCRGRLLLDPAGFARLLGVDVGHLAALESGWRPPDHAPRRLARLAPDLGWPSVGIDLQDRSDPSRRHPSSGQVGGGRGENLPP